MDSAATNASSKPTAHLDNHANYLASWLRVLKADSRAILTAAARAEEASAYLLHLGGRIDAQAAAAGEEQAVPVDSYGSRGAVRANIPTH